MSTLLRHKGKPLRAGKSRGGWVPYYLKQDPDSTHPCHWFTYPVIHVHKEDPACFVYRDRLSYRATSRWYPAGYDMATLLWSAKQIAVLEAVLRTGRDPMGVRMPTMEEWWNE